MQRKRTVMSMLAVVLSLVFIVSYCHANTIKTPGNSSFKSFMDYRTITNTNSMQYKIQQGCVTDGNGLRTYNGRYTVAVGTGFGANVGDQIDVRLDTGAVIHCVIGDMKQDAHTGADNIQVTHNGNIVEFIVDIYQLDSSARSAGDISKIPGFEGDVTSVTVGGAVALQNVEEQETVHVTDREHKYLIVAKSDVPLASGGTLYAIDYAFDGCFNNIICSEEFYNSVSVGDVLDVLE